MKLTSRWISRGFLTIGAVVGPATSPAVGQGLAPGGSLGGYGAASAPVDAGMGAGGPLVIPYSGRTEGFMPGRMGGGSPLSFGSRPKASMAPSRAPSGLSTMSGGMSAGLGRNPFPRSTMSGPPGLRGVMPTRIGYPFRQPPSLLSPSTTGPGMSM